MKTNFNFIKDLYFEMLNLKAKVCVRKNLVRMTYPKTAWQDATWHYVDVEEFDDFFKQYATNKK